MTIVTAIFKIDWKIVATSAASKVCTVCSDVTSRIQNWIVLRIRNIKPRVVDMLLYPALKTAYPESATQVALNVAPGFCIWRARHQKWGYR